MVILVAMLRVNEILVSAGRVKLVAMLRVNEILVIAGLVKLAVGRAVG